MHVRSDVAVGATDSNCESAHTTYGLHERSDVAVGAKYSQCVVVLHTCTAAHCRSAISLPLDTWYSFKAHVVSVPHTRSELAVDAVNSYSSVASHVV